MSFEPLPEPYKRLSGRSAVLKPHTAYQVALGRQQGVRSFVVATDSTCSSPLPPLPWFVAAHPGARPAHSMNVQVQRLDAIAQSFLGPGDLAWLKLDTQGSEADVLDGATAIFGQTAAIEIELSTIPLYEGQSLLPDLWRQLTDAGFEPYWLERAYHEPRSGRLAQLDGLFVRAEVLPIG